MIRPKARNIKIFKNESAFKSTKQVTRQTKKIVTLYIGEGLNNVALVIGLGKR